MSDNLEKLRRLLVELFQLEQADLDFGIYRIMNQKRDEITRFLYDDLLPQVQEAFKEYQSSDRVTIEAELQKSIKQAESLGIDPDTSPKVQEQRKQLSQAVDITKLENEVFSDLYSFFRRYYDNGDFISLRRYKEGVYAIPYEGEEVKLYWANQDQYYIKTTEYFRDYSFKLTSGKHVHFKLVEADTEKDNQKAVNGLERRFSLVTCEPTSESSSELYMRFNYHPDTERRKQSDINSETVRKVFESLGTTEWRRELSELRPTEKNPRRTLLEKHLNDYTARNTFDYFIHKDLGGFLRRELDFYIKNEIMHLDDIESESVPKVEQYLNKIKVIRKIAHKVIDFLAQIENFQKKLWLKKKFVVETNYCVTLDRVPEKLYPEIIANGTQREEWVRLFAIDEINGDLDTPSYSVPLTEEFLKTNPFLVLDTRFFSQKFKDSLLASFEDIDEQSDGLLIHSENFQALNLLRKRYESKVNCIYIDPPYNTESDRATGKFLYKDSYEHSSWLSMIYDRIRLGKIFLIDDGSVYVSINEDELYNLKHILDNILSVENYLTTITVRVRHEDRILKGDKPIHEVTENLLAYGASFEHTPGKRIEDNTSIDDYVYEIEELREPETIIMGEKTVSIFSAGDYVIKTGDSSENKLKRINIRGSIREGNSSGRFYVAHIEPLFESHKGYLFKVPDMGADAFGYRYFYIPDDNRRNGDYFQGVPMNREETKEVPYPNLIDFERDFNRVGTEGSIQFRNGKKPISFIKHVFVLADIAKKTESVVLDFFAGSGSTGHAVLDFNRENYSRIKFILCEVESYFDTILIPRMKIAIMSQRSFGHLFKYIRLESYEDTLNNLELKRTPDQDSLLTQSQPFRESYMLSYMLDVESKGSPSLLNIEQFEDPFNYKLNISTGSASETKPVNVDLVETFNYLIGLTVQHIDHIRGFRVVQGTNPKGEKVLIIWRNLKEKSNDDLEEFFRRQEYNPRDMEFDLIYVNGDNNLENIKRPDETWKVRLIEEDFMRLMFDVEDV